MSETPKLQCRVLGAPCEAWRFGHPDLHGGALRRSPNPSRGEGRLARRACWVPASSGFNQR
eukprot:10385663-Alexandrium_andersonii.AAC.1